MGRQTCVLARAPSNLGTPLYHTVPPQGTWTSLPAAVYCRSLAAYTVLGF